MNESKLILGTVQFGLDYGINNTVGKPSTENVFEILDLAFDKGVTILDSADAYGSAQEIIGLYNQAKPGRFSINTKFKTGTRALADQLDGTLKQLQTDAIDTYFFHSFQDFASNQSVSDDLNALKKSGKIAKVGLSVYDNSEFKMAIESELIDVIQFPFNLLDNYHQRGELMRYAKQCGKELQVRSVFLQGLFFVDLQQIPSKLEPLQPYLKVIHDIAAENNVSVEALALLYALQQPLIDYVIIGVDNAGQFRKNADICSWNLDSAIFECINGIEVSETSLLYPKNWK